MNVLTSGKLYKAAVTIQSGKARDYVALRAPIPSGAEILRRCPVPVIRSGGSLPEKGVFLITLAHAKGLEFDGVILPDCDADNYPDTVLARHRLYTALSRATRRLTVLAQGSMTPLLEKK